MDNIEYNVERGTHSFASNKELPWHKKGQIVKGAMTSEEAIKLANLDYKVRKNKIAVILPEELRQRPDGTVSTAKWVPKTYATYREDTLKVFGVVSDKYQIVQNSKAFQFMDSIIGEGKAIYETAGVIGDGQTVFITAKLPYYIKIEGNDVIENYLVVSNGHDGKRALNIFLTPVRIVCANTLTYGLRNNVFNLKLRHTTNINDRLEDAHDLLHISSTISEEMQILFRRLAKIKVNDGIANAYFNNLILNPAELAELATQEITYDKSGSISTRKKNTIKAINKFYHSGAGQDNIIGTAFGAYNAYTGWMSNVKNFSNDGMRMESMVLGGTDYKKNVKALDLAIALEN